MTQEYEVFTCLTLYVIYQYTAKVRPWANS